MQRTEESTVVIVVPNTRHGRREAIHRRHHTYFDAETIVDFHMVEIDWLKDPYRASAVLYRKLGVTWRSDIAVRPERLLRN
jgi:hypothetical protein